AQPVDSDLPADRGYSIDRAIRPPFLPLDGLRRDQSVALQPLDRLVERAALADIDDLVLAAGLDQLLHPIRVHRRFGEQRQHGEGEGRALVGVHSHANTSYKMTSQDI